MAAETAGAFKAKTEAAATMPKNRANPETSDRSASSATIVERCASFEGAKASVTALRAARVKIRLRTDFMIRLGLDLDRTLTREDLIGMGE